MDRRVQSYGDVTKIFASIEGQHTMDACANKPGHTSTHTDWERLQSMTDEDIALAVANDPDAAPIPTEIELEGYKPAPARGPASSPARCRSCP